MNHPAACPYCDSRLVNQVCADYQLRVARLNRDDTITVGESDQGVDFDGAMLLHCNNCASTFVQPASVTEHYDDGLEDPVEAAMDLVGFKTPTKDDPRYIGNKVTWLALPQITGEDNAVHEALKAMLVCTLDSGLGGWMAEHDPSALQQLHDAITNLRHVLELNGLDTVNLQRI
jgi:hypothetical protein